MYIQIKILYDNKSTKNVHQIPTYIQKTHKLYKTHLKFKVQTKNSLKL